MDLISIYNEMKIRNYNNIVNNFIYVDENLNNITDNRRCLAILERYDYTNFYPTNIYYELLSDLYKLFDKQLIYNINNNNIKYGCLHHTLLQILNFNDIKNYKVDIDQYKNTLHYLNELKYNIEYTDISFVKSGICLLGYPNIDLNDIRKKINLDLIKNNLPISNISQQNIVHSTILRFSNTLIINKDNIDYIIKKYNGKNFATGFISKLQIEFATWKT